MKRTICIMLAAVCLLLCCGCAAANPGVSSSIALEGPAATTQPTATTTPVVTTVPAHTTVPTAAPTVPTVPTMPTEPTEPVTPPPQNDAQDLPFSRHVSQLFGTTYLPDDTHYRFFLIRSEADIQNLPEQLALFDGFLQYNANYYAENSLFVMVCNGYWSALAHDEVSLQKTEESHYMLTMKIPAKCTGVESVVFVEVPQIIAQDATIEMQAAHTLPQESYPKDLPFSGDVYRRDGNSLPEDSDRTQLFVIRSTEDILNLPYSLGAYEKLQQYDDAFFLENSLILVVCCSKGDMDRQAIANVQKTADGGYLLTLERMMLQLGSGMSWPNESLLLVEIPEVIAADAAVELKTEWMNYN